MELDVPNSLGEPRLFEREAGGIDRARKNLVKKRSFDGDTAQPVALAEPLRTRHQRLHLRYGLLESDHHRPGDDAVADVEFADSGDAGDA